MMKYSILISLILLFLAPVYPVHGQTSPKEIRIGWISQSPEEQGKKLEPFADYLEKKLKPSGFENVRVVISGSVHSMAYLIDRDKVDLLFESIMPTLGIAQITDMDYLLRQWKNGLKEYRSVVVVQNEENIQNLKQLKGYAFAMYKPFSSSGYLLARYHMEKEGMKFHRMKRADEKIPNNEVGYLFSFDREASLRWVELGNRRAAVISDYFFGSANDFNKKLKVVFTSPSIYRHVVSARADLNPKVRETIVEILLNMDEDPEGRKVLQTFSNTLRFDKFPGGAETFEKSLEPYVPYIREQLNL